MDNSDILSDKKKSVSEEEGNNEIDVENTDESLSVINLDELNGSPQKNTSTIIHMDNDNELQNFDKSFEKKV